MSNNPWQSKTDALFFHAQYLLDLADENVVVHGSFEVTKKIRADSCELAASLVLQEALLAWVNELQIYIKPGACDIDDVENVWSMSFDGQPEWTHLKNLKLQKNSWLCQLLLRNRGPAVILNFVSVEQEGAAVKAAKELAAEASGIIALTDLASAVEPPMSLSEVMTQFRTYVLEVRSRQAHW